MPSELVVSVYLHDGGRPIAAAAPQRLRCMRIASAQKLMRAQEAAYLPKQMPTQKPPRSPLFHLQKNNNHYYDYYTLFPARGKVHLQTSWLSYILPLDPLTKTQSNVGTVHVIHTAPRQPGQKWKTVNELFPFREDSLQSSRANGGLKGL